MKRVNPAIEENIKIYSGVFFPNGLHMTYDYRGGSKGHPIIPFDMEQGQICYVFIENITFTSLFVAAQVYFYITPDHKVTVQYDNATPLHITLHTAKGVKPAISGTKLMEYLNWNNKEFFNSRSDLNEDYFNPDIGDIIAFTIQIGE